MSHQYPAVIEPDGKFLMVTFPDIPEANSMGTDVPDALVMAADALETAFELYRETGRPFPMPSPVREGQYAVSLPSDVCERVLMWNREKG